MFNRCTVTLAICMCSLGTAANAANPLTDYPTAKPGDAGYVAEDPQLAHLVGMPGPSITLRSIERRSINRTTLSHYAQDAAACEETS